MASDSERDCILFTLAKPDGSASLNFTARSADGEDFAGLCHRVVKFLSSVDPSFDGTLVFKDIPRGYSKGGQQQQSNKSAPVPSGQFRIKSVMRRTFDKKDKSGKWTTLRVFGPSGEFADLFEPIKDGQWKDGHGLSFSKFAEWPENTQRDLSDENLIAHVDPSERMAGAYDLVRVARDGETA